MPKFNVHLYREMRLFFPDVEASNAQEAAELARDFQTEDAKQIDDCEGVSLGALVGVVGDENFDQSKMINYPVTVTKYRY